MAALICVRSLPLLLVSISCARYAVHVNVMRIMLVHGWHTVHWTGMTLRELTACTST